MTRALLAALLLGLVCVPFAGARSAGGQPVALVTAERQNELLAVFLPQCRVVRRVPLPADPENVVAGSHVPTVVVSARAGAVTLLDWRTLRVLRIFRRFRSPHLAAFAPDREWAYVTDDASGELIVIRLDRPRIVARLFVGIGAHHLAFAPDESEVWIALGERASSVALLDTHDPQRPRLLGRFRPGFTVHDLAFSPDGRQVWLTSDDEPVVHVLDPRTRRELFTVPAGPPPQHVAFDDDVPRLRGRAWVTSGYGSRIELVDTRTGRVRRVQHAPYGSFNVVAMGGLVVTSSLLTGTLAEFDANLRPLARAHVAGAARDVAGTVW